MLKRIPRSLSPDLVKVLMEMGHGDELVIGDGNFPAASHAQKLIRCDGMGTTDLLTSILELIPLDTYADCPVLLMAVAESSEESPEIWQSYKNILKSSEEDDTKIEYLDRFEFYKRSREAYAIVATSEKALYANIILKKGVIS